MGYTFKKWQKRIRTRSDISANLTHFTRETEDKTALDILIQILTEKKIKGSTTETGFIVGDQSAVCFQESPLYSLTQNLLHEQYMHTEIDSKIRYKGFGLSFSKKLLFNKGARPVIYEKTEIAKDMLDENDYWRIVSLDLSDKDNIIDWTHEREWRMKGDLTFKLEDAYVYLVNKTIYQNFVKSVDKELLEKLKGIVVLDPVLT